MFFAVSLYFLYSLGLGGLAFFKEQVSLKTLAKYASVAMLIQYAVFFVFRDLKIGFVLLSILSFLGWLMILKTLLKERSVKLGFSLAGFRFLPAIFTAAVFFIVSVYCFSTPISHWDARSIWFFHAKIIYFSEGLFVNSGWQNPGLAFANRDYQKLFPVLAAQSAYFFGVWNEYLPKLTLLQLLLPPLFVLGSFFEKRVSFLILFLSLFTLTEDFLWNGYLDAFIMLYTVSIVLLLMRFFKESHPSDLLLSTILSMVLLNLKNEGIVILIALVCAVTIYGILVCEQDVFGKLKEVLKVHWVKFSSVCFIGVFPFVFWSILKKQWGLKYYYQIGDSAWFERFFSKLFSADEFGFILKNITITVSKADDSLMLLSVITILFLGLLKPKKSVVIQLFFPSVVSFFYFWILVVNYLGNPVKLTPGAERVMFTITALNLTTVYYVVKELESKKLSFLNPIKGFYAWRCFIDSEGEDSL